MAQNPRPIHDLDPKRFFEGHVILSHRPLLAENKSKFLPFPSGDRAACDKGSAYQ
jgi:hypothetical protein